MCFFFKQKTAYEMRISDWSSDVCSSDLIGLLIGQAPLGVLVGDDPVELFVDADVVIDFTTPAATRRHAALAAQAEVVYVVGTTGQTPADQVVIDQRSEEHPSELQSLMRDSLAVISLTKKHPDLKS